MLHLPTPIVYSTPTGNAAIIDPLMWPHFQAACIMWRKTPGAIVWLRACVPTNGVDLAQCARYDCDTGRLTLPVLEPDWTGLIEVFCPGLVFLVDTLGRCVMFPSQADELDVGGEKDE